MGSDGMVQELERLRKLLDATPAEPRVDRSGGVSSSEAAYNGALNAAEVCNIPLVTQLSSQVK